MKLELNSTDIEEYAVSAVESEIQKYPDCLKSYINKGDKIPMWDGEIAIYNNYKKRNEDWEYKFDIQVKGTQVEKFSEGNISFSIDVITLKNYQKTGSGTLFFVVEIINSCTTKIYYRNLLPVDIKGILDKIKENQKTVSILCKPIIPKTPSSMRCVCLNFAKNSQLQQGAIIKNINELKDIHNIEIPLIIDKESDFDDFLFSQNVDIYSYATLENGQKFALPKFEKLCKFGEVKARIKVGKKEYYNTITFFRNKDGNSALIGKSLICYLYKNNIMFKLNGNLYERIKDINFILDVINNNGFYINDFKFEGINKDTFGEEFLINIKNELENLEKLKMLFEKYNIKFDVDFSLLQESDWKNILIFQQINEGKYLKANLNMNLYHIDIYTFKIIFLTVKNANSFDTYNYFSDLKNFIKVFYFDSEQKEEAMSPYVNLTEEHILEASNFNTEIVKQSFTELDSTKEVTCEYIRNFVLTLLKAYDKDNTRTDILDLAYDLNELIKIEKTKVIDKINAYQILKRKRSLSEQEIDELYIIKDSNDDIAVQVAISLLLDNKSDFNRYFNKLNIEEQELLKQFPIYHFNKSL